MSHIFKGSAPALITPFDENGISYKNVEKLLNFHIKEKSDALVILGTTGENPTVTDTERTELVKFVIDKVNGKMPIIVGTGSNDTQTAIRYSVEAEKLGADAILVVTPYYNKATQRGLIEHYKAINDAVSIPIIVYTVPSRTSVSIAPETLAELAQLSNIKAIKDATANLELLGNYRRLCGDKIDFYSGDDATVVPFVSMGGIGVISVVANIIPRAFSEMVHTALKGNYAEASKIQVQLLPLIASMFVEVSPIPVKAACEMLGITDNKRLRLPLTEATQSTVDLIKKELTQAKNF